MEKINISIGKITENVREFQNWSAKFWREMTPHGVVIG